LAGSNENKSVEVTMRAKSANCNLAAHTRMQLFALIRAYLQGSSGAAIASDLVFEPGFAQVMTALGVPDASPRKTERLAFFDLKLP